MKCYVCGAELKMYGKESPLDGERVCDECFQVDQFNNDNLRMKEVKAKIEKFRLDTFGCDIHIAITDSPNEYLESVGIPQTDFNSIGGMTIYAVKDLENYYIIFPSETPFEAIVHESVHCINKIFLHRGVRMDFDNDEHYAYHVSWLADKIFCFIDDIYKAESHN